MLGVMALLSAGCATTKQLVPLPDQSKAIDDPTKARIYVLRPTSFAYAVAIGVRDGDMRIGSTGPNGYLCWEREPGETEIRSKAENTAVLKVKCDAGMTYFIAQNIRMGILFARNKLSQLSESEGKEKLKKCKPPKLL
jgi:hypothetical protein